MSSYRAHHDFDALQNWKNKIVKKCRGPRLMLFDYNKSNEIYLEKKTRYQIKNRIQKY